MYIFIILLQDITMVKLCQKSVEELLDKSYVELYFVSFRASLAAHTRHYFRDSTKYFSLITR